MSVRVVLADDHALVRAGFRSLVDEIPGCQVVAEVSNGREALTAVAEMEPDLVLMDVSMPDMNGLEATARIVRRHPNVRILLLSMHRERAYVTRALREGAHGYLIKDIPEAELSMAINAVLQGGTYVSSAVSGPLIRDMADDEAPSGPFGDLTPRQREVLQLIAEGNSTSEIATKLFLSVKTVESHRAAIQDRLGIRDVPGLVRYAIRHGLATLEE